MEKVFEYFKLDKTTESIYKYSPVFTSELDGKRVVIKKTKSKTNQMIKLFQWTEKLTASDINVVRPIMYNDQEYKRIDENNWVLYEFIDGREYTGSYQDILDAGELLGRIHHASASGHVFEDGFSWDKYDDAFLSDVEGDIESLTVKYQEDAHVESFKLLAVTMKELLDEKFSNLSSMSLPHVDATWDYKANNLIYGEKGLVLIDPDNAGKVPRIFDLALALLLFHMEIETAAPRMFNNEEWEIFKKGYFKHVELTTIEKKIWNEYLLFVFMDEVLWAMSDLEDDESDRQKEFIKSLLAFDPQCFNI